MTLGSPKEYTEELADKVCELLMDGYSLRKIEAIAGMPKRLTILKWLRENESFQTQYAHAREEQADCLADEMLDIADSSDLPSDDRRVKIDTRKWYAGKLRPKKYGDSTTLKGDKENPLHGNLLLIAQEINGRSSGLPEAESES